MTTLVTGSSGALGSALVRALRALGRPVRGIDTLPGPGTDSTASITDRAAVQRAMAGVQGVLHTATLHAPHIATHSRQAFIDTNVSGTLNLLEEAAAAGVRSFVFTSSTSTYGDAMQPAPGAPAVWVDEDLQPLPRTIYGVTKLAAEALCALLHHSSGMPCVVLRTSRFFRAPAELVAQEMGHRRVHLADAVSAHLCAAQQAGAIGFGRYVVSASSPFLPDDLPLLATDAAAVLRLRVPGCEAAFARAGWQLPQRIDRVYVNALARRDLCWAPQHTLASLLAGFQPP